MFNDVVMYGLECLAHWGEELFGQATKEQVTNQVDVARGGFDDRSPAPEVNLISGALRLRRQRKLPMADAAEAHRLLEEGETQEKLLLEAQ
jgi:hypothetical protein